MASTTISPTKVVDESEFTVEENSSVQEEKGEEKEDGFPDLSMFSPLGGRKVTYSSSIKRLLKDLEGERNRFRSQFQTQIQGLLTSFEEEQNHSSTVIIISPSSSCIEAYFSYSATLSIGICWCIASNSLVETTLPLPADSIQFADRYAAHASSLLRREY